MLGVYNSLILISNGMLFCGFWWKWPRGRSCPLQQKRILSKWLNLVNWLWILLVFWIWVITMSQNYCKAPWDCAEFKALCRSKKTQSEIFHKRMKITFKINSKALDETCNCENPPASSLHCKASMEDLFGDRTCYFLHNNNPKHTMHNASVAQVHLISASEPYCIRT